MGPAPGGGLSRAFGGGGGRNGRYTWLGYSTELWRRPVASPGSRPQPSSRPARSRTRGRVSSHELTRHLSPDRHLTAMNRAALGTPRNLWLCHMHHPGSPCLRIEPRGRVSSHELTRHLSPDRHLTAMNRAALGTLRNLWLCHMHHPCPRPSSCSAAPRGHAAPYMEHALSASVLGGHSPTACGRRPLTALWARSFL